MGWDLALALLVTLMWDEFERLLALERFGVASFLDLFLLFLFLGLDLAWAAALETSFFKVLFPFSFEGLLFTTRCTGF